MALYHFQVRTDTHVLLSEGIELPGLIEARVEAAIRVGDLLKRHAAQLWADEDWHLDVTDHTGLILFSIMVAAVQSAAAKGAGID